MRLLITPESYKRCVQIERYVHDRHSTTLTADMAGKNPNDSDAPFATRVDPTKENLTQEQRDLIRRTELEQWKKKTHKLRTRNAVTALAIGALVVGIYGYTFYSVSQERIVSEIDEEAKHARLQGPKTGAN